MKLQDILKDAWEVASLHYQFLHLGYFYSLLSKEINFSRIAFNINIETGPGQGFLLNRAWIQKVLEEIYSRPQDTTTVEYLTLLNSVRGIVGAVREALDHKEFKEAFKKIFPEPNQEQTYLNFEGALRFIRNVLTHNIRDEIILQENDIRAWKKKGMGSKPIEFQYDYSSPNSPIHLPDYKAKVDIRIELDKIMPGKTRYFEIVNVFQNLMFAEFCYNALCYLIKECETHDPAGRCNP
jgi:hypothetical protein